MKIDTFHRYLVKILGPHRVPIDTIGDIIGQVSESNQAIYIQGYNKGYNDGYKAGCHKEKQHA